MKKLAFSFLILGVVAFGALAQEMPPGKWWRHPRLVQQLALTEEQQSRLDGIFKDSAAELIDLKAEVEKRGLALRNELDQSQLNRQNIQRAADSLSQARGRLFQRELMMFVEMRSVLSSDQWGQFRHFLEKRESMRKEQRRRGPMGPGDQPRRGRKP